jgi:hypothetical protein
MSLEELSIIRMREAGSPLRKISKGFLNRRRITTAKEIENTSSVREDRRGFYLKMYLIKTRQPRNCTRSSKFWILIKKSPK